MSAACADTPHLPLRQDSLTGRRVQVPMPETMSLDVNLARLAADLVGAFQSLRLMSDLQRQQGEQLSQTSRFSYLPPTPGDDFAEELPDLRSTSSGPRWLRVQCTCNGSRAAILALKESSYSEAGIRPTKRFDGNCLFAIDSAPQVLCEISHE